MWQCLQRLFKRSDTQLAHADPAFIDRLVDIACPRIKLANGYRSRLAPLVQHACEAVRTLEEKMPPPLLLTAEIWRRTPLLNLAFSSPERMSELAAASDTVLDWFAERPLADSAFAILALTHEVAHRYGMEEHDGMVRQDVLQEVLVLRDHRFGVPVATAAELVHQARLRAMEELAHHATRRIQGLETDRDHIESEINTLRIALRINGSTDPLDASPMQHQRMKRLSFLTDELVATRKSLEPEALLNILVSALRDPQGQLRFTETHLRVDSMGILRDQDTNSPLVNLIEIEMIDEIPVRRVLLPVEIPRSLIQREEGVSAEAAIYNINSF